MAKEMAKSKASSEPTVEEIGAACAAVAAAWDKPNINARQMLLSVGFWQEMARALRGEAPPAEPEAEEKKEESA